MAKADAACRHEPMPWQRKLDSNRTQGLTLRPADRVFKYDLSLKPGEMYGLVEETRQRLVDFPSCTVRRLPQYLTRLPAYQPQCHREVSHQGCNGWRAAGGLSLRSRVSTVLR